MTSPLTTKHEIIALLHSNQPALTKQRCLDLRQKTANHHVWTLLATAHLCLVKIDAAVLAANDAKYLLSSLAITLDTSS